jgi:hypothetical protein
LKPCRNGAESTRQSTRLSRTCMAMLYSSVMQRSRHRARRCNMPQRNASVFAHAAKGRAYVVARVAGYSEMHIYLSTRADIRSFRCISVWTCAVRCLLCDRPSR